MKKLIIVLALLLSGCVSAPVKKTYHNPSEPVVIFFDTIKPPILFINDKFIGKYYKCKGGLVVEFKNKE